MIRSVKELQNFTIGATDGQIGSIKDVYFDDESWAIRYLVVKTGGWLSGRSVLISPVAVQAVQWLDSRVDVHITRKQVEGSPGADTNLPISRQLEAIYHDYYGYPYYWGGPYLWGAAAYPGVVAPKDAVAEEAREQAARARAESDPRLQSCKEVVGYHLKAVDGEIGHIEDFLFEENSWAIRYAEVDTRNWWPGKLVLIAPQWIRNVGWETREAYLSVTRDFVRSSPEYDPTTAFTSDYESRLRRHYEQAGLGLRSRVRPRSSERI